MGVYGTHTVDVSVDTLMGISGVRVAVDDIFVVLCNLLTDKQLQLSMPRGKVRAICGGTLIAYGSHENGSE